jgi:hypothetical protein
MLYDLEFLLPDSGAERAGSHPGLNDGADTGRGVVLRWRLDTTPGVPGEVAVFGGIGRRPRS